MYSGHGIEQLSFRRNDGYVKIFQVGCLLTLKSALMQYQSTF